VRCIERFSLDFHGQSLSRAAGTFLVVVATILALPTTANADWENVAIWHMEHNEHHKMRDASTSVPANHGATTDVRVVDGWDGRGYKFNGSTSRVVVPDHASLDPGTRRLQITTHAKFRYPPVSGVYLLVGKGVAKTSYYKMLIGPHGRAVCSFNGSLRAASVRNRVSLIGPQRHTIVCTKTKRWISITIDGVVTSLHVHLGAISNARRLFVGAGATGGSAFRGGLDETIIRVG
jgi:hypothetical protein